MNTNLPGTNRAQVRQVERTYASWKSGWEIGLITEGAANLITFTNKIAAQAAGKHTKAPNGSTTDDYLNLMNDRHLHQ